MMCSRVSNEYRVQYNDINSKTYVLFTSEAKGLDDGYFKCLIQALEIAVDCAINLSRYTNISHENCSIPGIIVYGDKVQFYGGRIFSCCCIIIFTTIIYKC